VGEIAERILARLDIEAMVGMTFHNVSSICTTPSRLIRHLWTRTYVQSVRGAYGIGLAQHFTHLKSAEDHLKSKFWSLYHAPSSTAYTLQAIFDALPQHIQKELPQPPYFGCLVQSQQYQKFGAHFDDEAVTFSVAAPKALGVTVDLYNEEGELLSESPLQKDKDGSWSLRLEDAKPGLLYAYQIIGEDGVIREKMDPFARELRPRIEGQWERAPKAVIQDTKDYAWSDAAWLSERAQRADENRARSILEVHAGSWNSKDGKPVGYRKMADQLVAYCKKMHYTDVELFGLLDHPHPNSWGYLASGYFTPESRLGSLDDFRYLVNTLHKHKIGVIIDFIPSHFAEDKWGLVNFDGSSQYELSWFSSLLSPVHHIFGYWGGKWFNYSSKPTRDFLISSARYWVEELHVDGLRVDALTAVLNRHNRADSTLFLRDLNATIKNNFPGVLSIAEDFSGDKNTARPIEKGGYGFDYKWHPAWFHHSLTAIEGHKPEELSMSLFLQALQDSSKEKTVLALSHDEVGNGKKTLFGKTQGEFKTRLAQLRLLRSFQLCVPGKKLTCMGEDWAPTIEWSEHLMYNRSLDHKEAQDDPERQKLMAMVSRLNLLYQTTPALHEKDSRTRDLTWLGSNLSQKCLAYLRHSEKDADHICAHNISAKPSQIRLPLTEYKIRDLKEIFNSDAKDFGGSGQFHALIDCTYHKDGSVRDAIITLAPHSTVILRAAG
jgi:1,4-alpha-glucan branching enzyme